MKFDAIEIKQGKKQFYAFKCKASVLWSFSQINQRQEDKDEGYQRVLSASRVKAIKNFITQGNVVPGSIVISFDKAKFENGKLEFTKTANAAWIIDGQHRSAGAAEAAKAGTDIELSIIAFVGLTPEGQADYFVTINKEAKGVPSSLYIDLLKHLPKQKTEKERLEERVADISRELSRDENSVFYQRIVSTTAPKAGEVSLTNFARILRPIIHPTNGILGPYNFTEQVKMIENYFQALKDIYPKHYAKNIFFRTLGFGAIFKAFPVVFTTTLKVTGKFRSVDVSKVLKSVSDFDFDQWAKVGSGTQAENMASDDFVTEFKTANETQEGSSSIALE